MIVFLTLLYVAVLALLIKLNIIKLTLFWKLSPLLWMLLLFIILFIPMQWGAPQGAVNVYQNIVEIIPNVSGEVIEVPAKGMQRVKKGEILFKIDPIPFQQAVNAETANLENARQQVEQLKEAYTSAESIVRKTEQDVALLKAEKMVAESRVSSAQAALRKSEVELETANELISTLTVNVDTAKQIVDRNERLLASAAVAQSEYDAMVFRYTELLNQLITAKNDSKIAVETISKDKIDVTIAETNVARTELRLQQLLTADLPRVKADAQRALIARDSKVGDEHTLIANAKAKLAKAKFDLDQTIVRAPADGYAIGVTLRPGQRVAAFPVRTWMSFVNEESTRIAVGVEQFALRHVKKGQPVEVTFKLYPGRIYYGKVEEVASVNVEGQLAPSGNVPTAPSVSTTPAAFGVILDLDEVDDIDITRLQGGVAGSAAIYTESATFAHVIRKVMIRMESWTNYVLP